MIAIPAVDVRGGACVQLVGGSYAEERVRITDAPAVARTWVAHGFKRLHVVDLDAATGAGDNAAIIEAILREHGTATQVGGGVRCATRVRSLFQAGAASVVVGTRAIDDAAWLAELAANYPGRITVAADVRGRQIVTHGWARTHALDILEFVRSIGDVPLAGLLVTAVHLEGQMLGTDLPLMESVVVAATVPVIAAGGITTIEDLRRLEERGVSAANMRMALYTGRLDASAVAREFTA